jgi:hypothetical protein
MIGLMSRNPRYSSLDATLPILVVAAALWSPLSAIGVVPFVLWRVYRELVGERCWDLLHPRIWMPAAVVGSIVVFYLILDPGGISKGFSVGKGDALDAVLALLQQTQFFLLEAGFIGVAIWLIRPSSEVVLALVFLALLPFAHFGPANDLAMRGSIPSLAVLVIGACLSLSTEGTDPGLRRKKVVLLCLLAVGAVTAVQEFARAILLKSWPINLQATLIGASCGTYPPHYVARLGNQSIRHLMRTPHDLTGGEFDKKSCDNPAIDLMWRRGLL